VGSLESRLRALEERTREPQRHPTSRTLEEIRAIDAEIARLEREMRAHGIDPYRKPDRTQTNSAGHPKLSLDEHIALLEAEIAREEQEHGES
jgi:hypothetical protein